MNTSKGALTSKGIWGGIIAILPQVAAIIDPSLPQLVTDGVSVAGGLLAIFGRFTANSRIGGLF
ncbi:MAG: hypothetical protein AAF317_00055 [Pseudomonadota bacterium]